MRRGGRILLFLVVLIVILIAVVFLVFGGGLLSPTLPPMQFPRNQWFPFSLWDNHSSLTTRSGPKPSAQ